MSDPARPEAKDNEPAVRGTENSAPHVVVIGGGLVGITSAERLIRLGCRVTVVERQESVSGECSFGNAALLMRSYSRPKTMSLRQMCRWATRKSEPVHISLSALFDPVLSISFGLRFLLAGPQTLQKVQETTKVIDALAEFSVRELEETKERLSLSTPFIHKGLLMFFESEEKLEALLKESREAFPDPEIAAERFRVLSKKECEELEPSLSHLVEAKKICGGILWPLDVTADALDFSKELFQELISEGVIFRMGVEVVTMRDHEIILSDGNSIKDIDAVVVASGVNSGSVLSQLNIDDPPPIPLYGMRGHSMTVDVSDYIPKIGKANGHVLNRSVCDADNMVFYSPLFSRMEGSRERSTLLRCAAFGDFDGWDGGPQAIRPWRIDMLKQNFRNLWGEEMVQIVDGAPRETLVDASSYSDLCPKNDPITRWCGLRPMSPDGMPVVGLAGFYKGGDENPATPVFINTGHGALGWTLSSASAAFLGESVVNAIGVTAARGTAARLGSRSKLKHFLDPQRFRWQRVFKQARRMFFHSFSI